MGWFYLALLAPLLFAIVNLIDDNLLRFVYKGPYLATAISGFFGIIPLVSLAFVQWTPIPVYLGAIMVLAGFLTTLFYFFYFRSLEVESPSVVIAMLGLVPATVPFLAYIFLGERLGATQILGFVVVLFATLGLAITEVKKFKFSAALIPVLVGVAILDATSILTKYVYDQTAFYPAYICLAAGMGLGGLYFMLIMLYDHKEHDLSVFKRGLHRLLFIFVGVELLSISAEFTTNLAISRGPVSLVKVIEGIQPIYVLLIALALYPFAPHFFREAAEDGRVKKFCLMIITIIGLLIIARAST